jgi:hypothetical protein
LRTFGTFGFPGPGDITTASKFGKIFSWAKVLNKRLVPFKLIIPNDDYFNGWIDSEALVQIKRIRIVIINNQNSLLCTLLGGHSCAVSKIHDNFSHAQRLCKQKYYLCNSICMEKLPSIRDSLANPSLVLTCNLKTIN